jgi:hypothetical protein
LFLRRGKVEDSPGKNLTKTGSGKGGQLQLLLVKRRTWTGLSILRRRVADDSFDSDTSL